MPSAANVTQGKTAKASGTHKSGQKKSPTRKHQAADTIEECDFQLKGSIRVVLTWNLTERAFLKTDGSRTRFPLLRGSGEFAKFIRNLGKRLASSDCFELDPDNQLELEWAYRAGLISQYAAEYEFNSTYRVKPGVEISSFLSPTEVLSMETLQPFVNAWRAWPIKRLRLSRYGFLQVILERGSGCEEIKDQGAEFVTSAQFVKPISLIHSSVGIETGPVTEQESERNWNGSPVLGVIAQWEIVGRILSRMIKTIGQDSTENDLLRFNPEYNWREKPGFTPGASLPLRTEFLIISISQIRSSNANASDDFTRYQRLEIARLLEEIPLVGDPELPELSPQRPEMLERVLQNDEATWSKEVCLLSFGTAVIAAVHSPNMLLSHGFVYENYWKVVERVFEYFAELRQLARLVERQASDLFEYMMRDLAASGDIPDYSLYARRSAALAGLVNRLRVAAAPATIAQSDSILPKVARLRSMFEIERSLAHADQTYSATQNLIPSAESRQNERGLQLLLKESQKNENGIQELIRESQKTEKGILLLTAGLAGFTAILMGLALPPYFKYSDHFEMALSRFGLPEIISAKTIIFFWGNFSVLLTGTALLTAIIFTVIRFDLKQRAKSLVRTLSRRATKPPT